MAAETVTQVLADIFQKSVQICEQYGGDPDDLLRESLQTVRTALRRRHDHLLAQHGLGPAGMPIERDSNRPDEDTWAEM